MDFDQALKLQPGLRANLETAIKQAKETLTKRPQ
jgi:hypothetical protein